MSLFPPRSEGAGAGGPRPDRDAGEGRVLRARPAVRPGQVVACSISLLCAGVLLTRGFIGLVPSRPVYVVLGVVLAVSALAGLTLDDVALRTTRDRPGQVLVDEVDRSRRFGHPLTLLQIRCDEATGARVAERMRATDRAWRRRGDLVVMLVETEAARARDQVARLADLVPVEDVRMASFPGDALTVDALLDALRPVTADVTATGGAEDAEAAEAGSSGRASGASTPSEAPSEAAS